MKRIKILQAAVLLIAISLMLMACPNSKEDDPLSIPEKKELTSTEKGILGTWYYYSNSYSEYRCITFNNDRTACYFEISSLSSSATKDNQKCYTNWYVDEDIPEGTIFEVNIIGDNTGGVYWAGYTIDTDDWILRKDGSTKMTETSKIECNFCN